MDAHLCAPVCRTQPYVRPGATYASPRQAATINDYRVLIACVNYGAMRDPFSIGAQVFIQNIAMQCGSLVRKRLTPDNAGSAFPCFVTIFA